MQRETFAVGALGCNCSLLWDDTSREAIVVDPGDEVERIVARLVTHRLRVTGIVHTHAHIDHVGATAPLARITGAPTYLHPDDRALHEAVPLQAQLLGLPCPVTAPMAEPLRDATELCFGRHSLAVLHTPGHTPGSVCFALDTDQLCLTGDTLFLGGIGRTDLPGGDPAAIERSIRHRLYPLHDDTPVIPGHGPATSIGRERRHNPFVRG